MMGLSCEFVKSVRGKHDDIRFKINLSSPHADAVAESQKSLAQQTRAHTQKPIHNTAWQGQKQEVSVRVVVCACFLPRLIESNKVQCR